MTSERTGNEILFRIVNTAILASGAVICVLPFAHILAMSLSANSAVSAGYVTLWPVDFTIGPYEFLLRKPSFWRAFLVSIQRVALGGSISMTLVILVAYPLSKENRGFRWRTVYVWFFFFTVLFNGGLIPLYLVVFRLRLMDTIWALVLPRAVPVFSIVIMLNFFRQLPKELEEAAYMDGAGHWRTLWMIYVPCSYPAIAAITLFTVVFYWNEWFDGLIFSNRTENYPLQSYLQTVIIGLDFSRHSTSMSDLEKLRELSDRTLKASQIIIAMIPVLMVYPFLQRYFVKGIVLGSVKG